jgi:hypothetical protein
MTVDEMLREARAMLTPRLSPVAAYDEMRQGALLVDIRYLEQRAQDGEIPNAAIISRNEFEWRCDPSAPWRHEMINKNDYEQRIIALQPRLSVEFCSRKPGAHWSKQCYRHRGWHAGLAFARPPGSALRNL